MNTDPNKKSATRKALSGLGVGMIVALVVLTTATAAGALTGTQSELSAVGDAAAQTSNGDTNTIRLQANGSITDYTFQANNLDALEKTDIEDNKDLIEGKRAIGSVGEGGIDKYQYTGAIHNFRSENASKVTVWINGEPVDPSSVGKDGELSSGSNEGEGSTPEPASADIAGNYELSNPNYGQQPIGVGSEITVTARITNTDDEKFSAEIGLGTQGEVVESQEVSLFPGSSQRISFEYTYDSPGTYAIQIGPLNESGVMTEVGLSTSNVTVLEEGEVTTTDTDESIGIATTSKSSGIPTVAQNEAADGSSFIKEPENLTVNDLSTAGSSPPFRPGDLLSFKANVSNPSSKKLNDTFTFTVDNDTVTQQTLTVSAGGSQSLVFTHRFAESGNYTISVGDKATRVRIEDYQQATPVSENMTTTSINASSGDKSGAVSGIVSVFVGNILGIIVTVSIIVIGIVVAGIVFMHRTRDDEDIHR